MDKKTVRFKTNLKCGNCVAKVKQQLDEASGIATWTIDLKSPDRILTAELEGTDASIVEKILAEAGYKAVLCPD